jgi:hypothetical protein
MPQPNCEPARSGAQGAKPQSSGPGGSITERLLADGLGLERLCAPLGTRYAVRPGDDGQPDGGSFSKYPGWDEQPQPWSQRGGSMWRAQAPEVSPFPDAPDAPGAADASVTLAALNALDTPQ